MRMCSLGAECAFSAKTGKRGIEKNTFCADRRTASTVSFNEGQTIPGIAHGVVLESCISSAKKEG